MLAGYDCGNHAPMEWRHSDLSLCSDAALRPKFLALYLALNPEALGLALHQHQGLGLEPRSCYEICDFLQRLSVRVVLKAVRSRQEPSGAVRIPSRTVAMEPLAAIAA